MFDFKRARKSMVDGQLRTSSITDRRILDVMGKIAREEFVPDARRELAYIDDVHLLNADGPRRYLSSPAPFARMIQLATIVETDNVLDVGATTGYSTAVLADLCGSVVGVETDQTLAAHATANLAAVGITNAKIVSGDFTSAADQGPFNVIIVEGTVEAVPAPLFDQLADGGRLVALLSQRGVAVANVYVKTGKGVAARQEFNANLPAFEISKRVDEFVF